jgi:hypothetical protein
LGILVKNQKPIAEITEITKITEIKTRLAGRSFSEDWTKPQNRV